MPSIHLCGRAGAVAGLLAPGAARADAADGERLARQWCVNCHVIDGSGPATASRRARRAFASSPATSIPGRCAAFLTHPHGAMPNLALTRAEIDDLIAYIESLK